MSPRDQLCFSRSHMFCSLTSLNYPWKSYETIRFKTEPIRPTSNHEMLFQISPPEKIDDEVDGFCHILSFRVGLTFTCGERWINIMMIVSIISAVTIILSVAPTEGKP